MVPATVLERGVGLDQPGFRRSQEVGGHGQFLPFDGDLSTVLTLVAGRQQYPSDRFGKLEEKTSQARNIRSTPE